MNKNIKIAVAAVAGIIILSGAAVAAWYLTTKTSPGVQNQAQQANNQVPPQNNLTEVPQTVSKTFSDEKSVVVFPDGTTLGNPFTFYGTSTAIFENQMNWRLMDGAGKQVAGGHLYTKSVDMGKPGSFGTIKAFFDKVPSGSSGSLELYDNSPKDGAEIYKFAIPVTFDVKAGKVSVYFPNTKNDPEMLDCSKVYAVERTVALGDDKDVVAMHELLKGLTEAEKSQGYITSLPTEVNDPEITIGKGAVIADFDMTLEKGMGGSCRVSTVRSQLEQTLKAVYPDDQVILSVNGRTEDILQP